MYQQDYNIFENNNNNYQEYSQNTEESQKNSSNTTNSYSTNSNQQQQYSTQTDITIKTNSSNNKEASDISTQDSNKQQQCPHQQIQIELSEIDEDNYDIECQICQKYLQKQEQEKKQKEINKIQQKKIKRAAYAKQRRQQEKEQETNQEKLNEQFINSLNPEEYNHDIDIKQKIIELKQFLKEYQEQFVNKKVQKKQKYEKHNKNDPEYKEYQKKLKEQNRNAAKQSRENQKLKISQIQQIKEKIQQLQKQMQNEQNQHIQENLQQNTYFNNNNFNKNFLENDFQENIQQQMEQEEYINYENQNNYQNNEMEIDNYIHNFNNQQDLQEHVVPNTMFEQEYHKTLSQENNQNYQQNYHNFTLNNEFNLDEQENNQIEFDDKIQQNTQLNYDQKYQNDQNQKLQNGQKLQNDKKSQNDEKLQCDSKKIKQNNKKIIETDTSNPNESSNNIVSKGICLVTLCMMCVVAMFSNNGEFLQGIQLIQDGLSGDQSKQYNFKKLNINDIKSNIYQKKEDEMEEIKHEIEELYCQDYLQNPKYDSEDTYEQQNHEKCFDLSLKYTELLKDSGWQTNEEVERYQRLAEKYQKEGNYKVHCHQRNPQLALGITLIHKSQYDEAHEHILKALDLVDSKDQTQCNKQTEIKILKHFIEYMAHCEKDTLCYKNQFSNMITTIRLLEFQNKESYYIPLGYYLIARMSFIQKQNFEEALDFIDQAILGFKDKGQHKSVLYTEAVKLKTYLLFEYNGDYNQCIELIEEVRKIELEILCPYSEAIKETVRLHKKYWYWETQKHEHKKKIFNEEVLKNFAKYKNHQQKGLLGKKIAQEQEFNDKKAEFQENIIEQQQQEESDDHIFYHVYKVDEKQYDEDNNFLNTASSFFEKICFK